MSGIVPPSDLGDQTMKKKRASFSEEEKAALKESVLKFRTVLENKKTDAVSVVEKNRTWEEVAAEFNSRPSAVKRTTAQLKKLWENIKFRRKMELGADKRERMKTGGGSYTSKIPEDPDLDSVGVDIEMTEDAVDSDTVFITSDSSYKLVGNTLIPIEEELAEPERQVMSPTKELSPEQQCSSWSTPFHGQNRKRCNVDSMGEDDLRKHRNKRFIVNDEEYHLSRMKEQNLKLTLVERQIQRVMNQMRHDDELHELMKQEQSEKIERKRKKDDK